MKYQWNKVDWLLSYAELKIALLDNQYLEDIGHGFIVDEAYQDNRIAGRYVIKNIIRDSITTPNGNIEELERITYSTFQFIINTDKTLSLTLINPPRSAIKLGAALGKITRNRVIFHSNKINLELWIDAIKNHLSDFLLRRIDIVQIPFSPGTSASMTLRGKGDLISSLTDTINYDKGIITRADFSFRSEFGIRKSSITHRGISTSQDSHTAEILYPILYNSLDNIINS